MGNEIPGLSFACFFAQFYQVQSYLHYTLFQKAQISRVQIKDCFNLSAVFYLFPQYRNIELQVVIDISYLVSRNWFCAMVISNMGQILLWLE